METGQDKQENEEYSEKLRFVVEKSYDVYIFLASNGRTYQVSIIKTYLWLASALLTFQTGFYLKIFEENERLCGQPCQIGPGFYWFGALALCSSLAAFTLGVDTLRGRSTLNIPFGDFDNLVRGCHRVSDIQRFYLSIIKAINTEIKLQVETACFKGTRMRFICGLILASVAFSVLTVTAWIGAN